MGYRIEIITIGNEVLMGEIGENNATYISRELGAAGYDVARITVLPDDIAVIAAGLTSAMERSDTVIVTGGLGPTVDDVTKDGAIRAFGTGVEVRPMIVERIAGWFRSLGREMPPDYRDQGRVPAGADVLPNSVGAAVGLHMESGRSGLYLIPGVPAEMRAMFHEHVLPRLPGGNGKRRHRIRTYGLSESELEHKLRAVMGDQTLAGFSIISAPSGVDIYPPAGLGTGREGRFPAVPGREKEERLLTELGSYVYDASGGMRLEEVVVSLLDAQKKKIATAESVTGGSLASLIVSVPGASNVLTEGFVTYHNDAKIQRLGVDAGSLERYGAVSVQVCIEMASGVRRVSGTDFGLATTGIAGPGGATNGKPAGLCYIGMAAQDTVYCRELRLPGDREAVRMRTAYLTLDMLRLRLIGAEERLARHLVRSG